jgi:hypothetical protein
VNSIGRTIVWVSVFAITFAFVEASVVVYLRALYYPAGFEFPLRLVSIAHLQVELAREAATLGMLVSVAALAGRKRWEQFGYFLVTFGVWDVFYYVWLKVALDWPAALTDWDVLFLIPLPWIGPVLAPVLISLVMIACGVILLRRLREERFFRPRLVSWSFSIIATALILYSFITDVPATMQGADPQPYRYPLLGAGVLLYIASFWIACLRPRQLPGNP